MVTKKYEAPRVLSSGSSRKAMTNILKGPVKDANRGVSKAAAGRGAMDKKSAAQFSVLKKGAAKKK